jgi:hypothetical protein
LILLTPSTDSVTGVPGYGFIGQSMLPSVPQ